MSRIDSRRGLGQHGHAAIRALDGLLSVACLVPLLGGLVLLALWSPVRRRRLAPREERRLMCLVPITLEALEAKGNVGHILDRDLSGYFEHVYTVHYPAPAMRSVALSNRHTVLEFTKHRFPALRLLPYTSMLLSNLFVVISLYRLVKSRGVSVIRAHDPYVQGLNAFIVSRLAGVPFVVSLVANYDITRGYDGTLAYPTLRFAWLEKAIERFVFHHAGGVLAVSDDYRDFAVRNGTARDKAVTIQTGGAPSTIHYEELHTRRDLKAELGLTHRHVVVYVGRLSAEKYPEDVVKCAQLVRQRRDDVTFLLAGDGPMRRDLEELIDALAVRENVRLLGFQPQERVRDLLYTADVILSPRTGIALVEAAMSGKPVVAYDHDWQREIIHDGATGLLVPFRDCEALAAAVLRAVDDPEGGRALGLRAREAMLRQYDRQRLMSEEIAYFERVLGGSHGADWQRAAGHRGSG